MMTFRSGTHNPCERNVQLTFVPARQSNTLGRMLALHNEEVSMADCLRRLFFPLILTCVCAASGPGPGFAQEVIDEDEPFLPGLIANYRDSQGHTVTRLD